MNQENKGTLERLVPGSISTTGIAHLHRYALAARFAAGKQVLDIACGEGYGSKMLGASAASVIGVDIDPAVVDHARRVYGGAKVSFRQGAADRLEFPDRTFDLVVSFETLEHHDRHTEMLTEIRRVLKPDGLLIISTPDRLNYSERRNFHNEFHIKELSRSEFETLLHAHFSQVRLYEQRMLSGSLVFRGETPAPLEGLAGDFNAVRTAPFSGWGEYLIALASSAATPELGSSYFDGDAAIEAERAAAVETMASIIRSSLSYRLGHALLAPLRLIRGRMKRL